MFQIGRELTLLSILARKANIIVSYISHCCVRSQSIHETAITREHLVKSMNSEREICLFSMLNCELVNIFIATTLEHCIDVIPLLLVVKVLFH